MKVLPSWNLSDVVYEVGIQQLRPLVFLALALPPWTGMGMAPLGLPTSPVPVFWEWPVPWQDRQLSYMLCPKISFVLSPVKYDCRFMEESLEMGLSEFGGSCIPRA